MLPSDKEKLKQKILDYVREMRKQQQVETSYFWKACTGMYPVTFEQLSTMTCVFHKASEVKHLADFLTKPLGEVRSIYISVAKTYQHIKESAPHIISKTFVMDCVSDSLFNAPKEPENCIYFSRPQTLRDLYRLADELAISQSAQLIVIDSLSDYVDFKSSQSRQSLQMLAEIQKITDMQSRKTVFLFDTARGDHMHMPQHLFSQIYSIEVLRDFIKTEE